MESRSKKRKRRRLISIASSVSSRQRADLPARFESLNDDTLTTVLEFVGNKSYAIYAGINKHCKEVYVTSGMTKETFYGYAPLSVIRNNIRTPYSARKALGRGVLCFNRTDVLNWALEGNDEYFLTYISDAASKEGRTDVLKQVLNYIAKDYYYDRDLILGVLDEIFESVHTCAARHGKLNVLKWLEVERLSFCEWSCRLLAARHGHLHIIQWFKEELGFQLDKEFYRDAAIGGHLHVMKWLREQACPWYESTFFHAAKEGNLDALQWLHDEGCPWPENSVRASEGDLKPEVVDWVRSNGYGSRLY